MKSRVLAVALFGATVMALSGAGPLAAASGPVANPALVSVLPTITATFQGPQAALGANGSMLVTVKNGNQAALTGVGFTLTATSGFSWANIKSTWCGGTVTHTANTYTVTGATIPNPSCGYDIDYGVGTSSSFLGTQTITASKVTSSVGTGLNGASASVTIMHEPVVAMSLSNPSVTVGGSSDLVFTITNSTNAATITDYGFVVALKTGISVTKGTLSACGGTVSLASPPMILASTLTVPAGGSCQVSVPVTGTAVGSPVATMYGSGLWPAAHLVATLNISAAPAPAATDTPRPPASAPTPGPAATPKPPASAPAPGPTATPRPSASADSSAAPSGTASGTPSETASGTAMPRESGTPAANPSTAPAGTSSGDGGSPLPLLLGVVVLLATVGAGVGAFFWRKRRLAAAG